MPICLSAVGSGTTADDSDDGESRAQYLNANCVVFTHYRGDAASEVEEHFQRALTNDKLKGENSIQGLLKSKNCRA